MPDYDSIWRLLDNKPQSIWCLADDFAPSATRLPIAPDAWETLSGLILVIWPSPSEREWRESFVESLYEKAADDFRLAIWCEDSQRALVTALFSAHFELDDEGALILGRKREKRQRRALLVFPPIIAPFPIELFSIQPSALLRLSTYLKSQGVEVFFHNMLPGMDSPEMDLALHADLAPDLVRLGHARPYGSLRCGNWETEGISKTSYLIGEDFPLFERYLKTLHFIDDVYISSIFTYHYKGTHETIKSLRRVLPKARITVGGIYPTLIPDHAKTSGADVVHAGPFEEIKFARLDFSQLKPTPGYAIIKLTRGCPFDCSFCAVHILEGHHVETRDVQDALEEMRELRERFGVKRLIFWESNLLVHKREFEQQLKRIADEKLDVSLLIPEGLMPSLVTDELARLLSTCHTEVLPLPLETADGELLTERFSKHSSLDHLLTATGHLKRHGLTVVWFVLLGYAGHRLNEFIRSLLFSWKHEVAVKLMAFTPIPGTREYERALPHIAGKDLAELAPECFSLAWEGFTVAEMESAYRLFNLTCYGYEQVLGMGVFQVAAGKLHRNYSIQRAFNYALPKAELIEDSVVLETRKEYFLSQTRELANPKTIVYYDAPRRAYFDAFDGVAIGREIDSVGFDFARALQLVQEVLAARKRLSLLIPRDAAEHAEAWLAFLREFPKQAVPRLIVNDDRALATLSELVGAEFVWRGRLCGETDGAPSRAPLPDTGSQQTIVDAIRLGDTAATASACFYPTSVARVSQNALMPPDSAWRLEPQPGTVLFARGRGRHLFDGSLAAFEAHSAQEILFQYSVPS